jgi:hypothetical protein
MNDAHGKDVAAADPLAARKVAAEECVGVALESIEQAQRFLDVAAQALCDVRGMAPEWRKAGALHDQVKRTWYCVRGKADSLCLKGRLLLDHEPRERERRRG